MQAFLQFDVETLCLAAEVAAVLLIAAIAWTPQKATDRQSPNSLDSHWDWEPFQRVFEKAVIGMGRGICCSPKAGMDSILKELYQDVPDPWKDRLTGMINAQGMDRLLHLWGDRVDAESTPSTITMFAVQSYEQLMFRRGSMVTEQAIRHLGSFLLEQLSGQAILSRYQPNRFLILQFGSDTEMILRELNEAIQKVNAPDFFMIKDESVPLMCMSRTLPLNEGSAAPDSLVLQLDETISSISGVAQNIGAEMVTPDPSLEPKSAKATSGTAGEETPTASTNPSNSDAPETAPSSPLGTAQAEFGNRSAMATQVPSDDDTEKSTRAAVHSNEDGSTTGRSGNVFAEVNGLEELVGSGVKSIVDVDSEKSERPRSKNEPSGIDSISSASRKSSSNSEDEVGDEEPLNEVTEEDFSTLFDSLQTPRSNSNAVGFDLAGSEDVDSEASPEEMIRQSRTLAQKTGMAGAIPMASSYTDDIEEATTKEDIRTLFATVRAATHGEFAKDPGVRGISKENVDELCDVKTSDAIKAFERGLEEPEEELSTDPNSKTIDQASGKEVDSHTALRSTQTRDADTPESGSRRGLGKGAQTDGNEEIPTSKPKEPSVESLDGDHLVSPDEIAKLFAAMRK